MAAHKLALGDATPTCAEPGTASNDDVQADPALLLNRGNDYLHYEDDWYIVGSKPDVYQFIYYKGNNDAWKGYVLNPQQNVIWMCWRPACCIMCHTWLLS